MRIFKISIYVSLLLSLLGCSQETEEQTLMRTYFSRLANVLNEDSQWKQPSSLPALPPQRLRLQIMSNLNEGLLDVLDLSKCDLLSLIASRNSSLGKLARPSQRLTYEIQFYTKVRNCLPVIENDPTIESELKERINNIYAIKKKNLPFIFWNALYTGQEIEASLAINQPPLSLLQVDYNRVLKALDALSIITTMSLLSDGAPSPSQLSNIEQQYEIVYHKPLGTPLLKSLLLLEAVLNNTADLINTRLARRPMCFANMQNPQANILKNVFTGYYAGQIQPYMAYVNRIGEQWFNIHTKTLAVLPIPAELENYAEQVFMKNTNMSIWNRYINARDKHTKAWQRILQQCNLMPTRPE